MEKALFAAGCFWGVQSYFDQVPGVVNTTVGYTGGHTDKPTYEDVCYHQTGHAEAVLIEFETQTVSYATLLEHFFRIHDPTQLNRQGPDVGNQYRSAVFYFSNEQAELAVSAKEEAGNKYIDAVVTEITEAGVFYPAEEYHQKYTEKTGLGLCRVAYKPF